MSINLGKALSWQNANPDEARMLQALQGNILKGHGRPEAVHLFFTIDPAKRNEMRAALKQLSFSLIGSAMAQLKAAWNWRRAELPGGVLAALFLSHTGYVALGVPQAEIPEDPDFVRGMKHADLDDPAPGTWDEAFRGDVHGLVLLAGEGADLKRAERLACSLLEPAGGRIVARHKGKDLQNDAGHHIEHFGYVDGRSQPIPLLEDVVREEHDGGIDIWNPGAPLDVALVPDPGAQDGVSHGSYFVYRKLEQNVRGFKRQEQLLADALQLSGDARGLAGAYVVGRFEDGTLVTQSNSETGATPVNNFDYAGKVGGKDDLGGGRCPFHAHIRKTNPRGTGGFESPEKERSHLMLRRAIPYEDVRRELAPKDVPESESLADFDAEVAPKLPTGGCGLLFMAYNRAIGDQFAFTQKRWANAHSFPRNGKPDMLDPVIGQPPLKPGKGQSWPKEWNNTAAGTTRFAFSDFVHMKGGEYFFAPSLTMLRGL